MNLEGKTAVITGGDTGIGRAIALEFAAAGACVVVDFVGDRSPADALVDQIGNSSGKAVAIEADVSKPEDVRRLIDKTVEHFGTIDVMVNNAGIEEKHPFLEMPLDVFEKVLAVNLRGTWLCSQIAARKMVEQKRGGRIINISSIHEDVTMPTNAPYCASKGAIRMLMRTIAVELAPHNITVNNVCPGAIDTPMDARLKRNDMEINALLQEIPMRRMGKPDEVAKLCAYLASDAAAYITGASFVVDGGMSKESGSL